MFIASLDLGSGASLWHADNQGSPARQFVVGDFRQELQVEAQSPAFLTCCVVEKVHDVSSEPILEPPALIEVERAYRIHFDIRMFAQASAQLTLESKRPLSYLCHGERNNAIRHRVKSRTLQAATTKNSSLCQLANRERPTINDQRPATVRPPESFMLPGHLNGLK
jgi:hypothetical protein